MIELERQALLPFYDDIDVEHFKRKSYWKGFTVGILVMLFTFLFSYIYFSC